MMEQLCDWHQPMKVPIATNHPRAKPSEIACLKFPFRNQAKQPTARITHQIKYKMT